MSKILGIDYGKVKVGLALGDFETKTAVPLEVIEFKNLKLKIENLIKSEDIDKIIVGLPLGMDGKETGQTKEVREFVEDLKRMTKDLRLKTNVEIVTEDERLSTVQAKRDGKDDAVAAMYILQSYIDKINNKESNH